MILGRSHLFKWLRRGVIAVLVFSVTMMANVFALSDYYAEFFYLNGIYYYDPDGMDVSCVTKSNGSGVTIIGDSITAGSQNSIQSKIPNAVINAKVGRTFGNPSDEPGGDSGISVLKELAGADQLGTKLIFALGTNNTQPSVSSQAIQTVIDEATTVGVNQIFFITNYNSKNPSVYDANNAAFSSAAQNGSVTLIDWKTAASADPEKYINQTDKLFVHPTPEDGADLFASLIEKAVGGSSTVLGETDYTNYNGANIFGGSKALEEKLEKLIPLYEKAIQNTGAASQGITWQLLAAIHYRENTFSLKNPKNGEGVWQLHDCKESGECYFEPNKVIDDAEFVEQTEKAIQVILNNAKSLGVDLSTDAGVKKLFFSYNGRSQLYKDKALAMGFSQEEAENGEGSPYVMNFYDERRDPNSPNVDPNWSGYICHDSDTTNLCDYSDQYGAFTVYEALGGAATSTCYGGGTLSGGTTTNDTLAVMKDYFSKDVICKDWVEHNCGYAYDGKMNCVTFVQYFLNRFTTIGYLNPIGHGGQVVKNITGAKYSLGIEYGTDPKPYAVFSRTGGEYGHTGIVMGVDIQNGKIYIAQAGLGMNLDYSMAVEKELSEYTSGKYEFAYIQPFMKWDELNKAIEHGKTL